MEFGSTGLATFRSFLGAFYLHHGDGPNFTDTRFYAFDIFGDPDRGNGRARGPQPTDRGRPDDLTPRKVRALRERTLDSD